MKRSKRRDCHNAAAGIEIKTIPIPLQSLRWNNDSLAVYWIGEASALPPLNLIYDT